MVFAAKQVRFVPLPIVIDSSGVFPDAFEVRTAYVRTRYVTIVSLGRAYSFPILVLPTDDVGAVRLGLELEFEPGRSPPAYKVTPQAGSGNLCHFLASTQEKSHPPKTSSSLVLACSLIYEI